VLAKAAFVFDNFFCWWPCGLFWQSQYDNAQIFQLNSYMVHPASEYFLDNDAVNVVLES